MKNKKVGYFFKERIASQLNLNIDLTLGSGWSSGGPFIDRFPEKQLIKSEIDFSKLAINDSNLINPQNWKL